MARAPKKTDNPPVIVTDADTPTLPAMVEAHDQFNRQLAVIDQQFGGGEYEITTYNRERVLNECKFFLSQSAQAMLEAGKRLILIKEHELHGEFLGCLERINIEPRIAQMMMKAALKFDTPKTKALSYLPKSKIYELMMLDDEELDALAEGGTVSGLKLDDIERMSTRELRAALRDAEGDLEASRQRVAVKEKETEKLTGEVLKLKRRVETQTPDEAAADIRKEAALFAFRAEHAIRGELRPAFQALFDHAEANGGDHSEFMLGLITQIEREANVLRAEFGLLKAKPDGEVLPDWMRDDVMEKIKADAEEQKPDWLREQEAANA